jgi:hypothetical protein
VHNLRQTISQFLQLETKLVMPAILEWRSKCFYGVQRFALKITNLYCKKDFIIENWPLSKK